MDLFRGVFHTVIIHDDNGNCVYSLNKFSLTPEMNSIKGLLSMHIFIIFIIRLT